MRSRWLFGAAPDLLLGCGLAWLAAFLLQGWVGSAQLSGWVPAGLLIMVTTIPHYGGTLLRVYESAEDRHKYAYFALHATVAIALLYVVGLHLAWMGSLVLTLYLTWSPWHYSGQNYGVALMLLGRRGVSVTPRTKRFVHASFVFSYLLTFVAIHGAERTANYAPVTYSATAFHLLPLGIPAALCELLIPVLALGYGVSLLGAASGLLRAGRPGDIAPAAVLAFTQGLWFSLPVLLRYLQLVDSASFFANVFTPYGFVWIAVAHSVQYLWVTSYYARTSGSTPRLLPYLGKAALAGYAVWMVPALLFAPNLLGGLVGSPPYDSGLALLGAAVVNLHHFVLDGAIWKLRDGRIARVLVRSQRSEPVPSGAPGRRWPAALAWGAGVLSVAVALFAFYEGTFGHERALAEHDVPRARVAARRLAWIGRDGPTIHREIGRMLVQNGATAAARQAYQRSLELYPTAGAWLELANLEEGAGDFEAALRGWNAAIDLDPDNAGSLYRAGLAELELGNPQLAVARLERATALAPDDGLIRLALLRARALAEDQGAPPL